MPASSNRSPIRGVAHRIVAYVAGTVALGVPATAQTTSATCRDELARFQADVLMGVPRYVDAIEPLLTDAGSGLDGYELGHGHVVLAGMGVTLGQFTDPSRPELLFYWPRDRTPSEWLDFDGPDGRYELVGWGYIPALFPVRPVPPDMPCVPADAWFIHDAGWHLLDGGMQVTAGNRLAEPPVPPELRGQIDSWHPAGWDIHFWLGDEAPVISFLNAAAPRGGKEMPLEAFWYPARVR